MGTVLSIEGDRFLINGKLTYSEIEHCPEKYHGLLMNARFIQGIFNDSLEPERFCRFGRHFDPEENTRELIKALPQWYAQGLRCFTAGFQGGGPCYTINSMTIDNNPFSADGRRMDGAYLRRMKDVILEVANEHDIEAYKIHPILYNDSGIAELIEIAKRESGGLPVGCSSTGAYFSTEITRASDVVLIHGNNMSRQIFYNQICQVKAEAGNKPVLCNEDSQALSNMQVALDSGVSWGYYNNMTKQEPPVVWGIKNDEDRFFAMRMAQSLGISSCDLPVQSCFEIAGLDDDPFSVNYLFNWLQMPVEGIQTGETVKAVIRLAGGQTIVKEKIAR